MDGEPVHRVSGIQAGGRRGRRVQRKVYVQPDGAARRFLCHARQPHSRELPQFLPATCALAIFGNPVGQMIAREVIALPQYAEEVAEGLLSEPKTLPCKLFYDAAGSAIFEEITDLPEYYLTRTELAILRDHSDEMARAIGTVTVVELGAGTAAKT